MLIEASVLGCQGSSPSPDRIRIPCSCRSSHAADRSVATGVTPDGHHLRRILLSMRSDRDRARASRLYHHIRPLAVEVILNLAAKCPELKAKARLPRCTVDPAYIMSFDPGSWGYKVHNKHKVGHIPAHVLARSFMLKRPSSISHDMNHPVEEDVDCERGDASLPGMICDDHTHGHPPDEPR